MTKPSKKHHGGFILPLTLGLLGFVVLWGSILLEHLHTQSQLLQKAIQEQDLFYRAQQHLQECLQVDTARLEKTSHWLDCCFIEHITPRAVSASRKTVLYKTYRFSTQHALVHAENREPMSVVRLQAVLQKHPLTQQIVASSWREIFDLAWEKDWPQTEYNPSLWKDLPLCQHTIQSLS